MLTFLAAFSYECFIAQDREAVWSAGAAWIIIALLVVWCIYSAWEEGDDSYLKKKASSFKEKMHVVRQTAESVVRNHFSCLFPLPETSPDPRPSAQAEAV